MTVIYIYCKFTLITTVIYTYYDFIITVIYIYCDFIFIVTPTLKAKTYLCTSMNVTNGYTSNDVALIPNNIVSSKTAYVLGIV